MFASFSDAAEVKQRKMTIDLVCGNIGVSANQREAIELAARHGFESVGADGAFLASLLDDQVPELKSFMKAKAIVFGAAGLPVEFLLVRQRVVARHEPCRGAVHPGALKAGCESGQVFQSLVEPAVIPAKFHR